MTHFTTIEEGSHKWQGLRSRGSDEQQEKIAEEGANNLSNSGRKVRILFLLFYLISFDLDCNESYRSYNKDLITIKLIIIIIQCISSKNLEI